MDPFAAKAVSYGTLQAQSFQLRTGGGAFDCSSSNGTLAVGGSNTATVQVSTSNVARLTVNSNGNVGIGTTVPLSRLDVNGVISNRGGSNAMGHVKLIQDPARTGYIDFRNPDDSRMGFIGYGDSNGLNLFMDQSVNLLFSTAGTERMRITSAGNVGIGTTAPSAVLDLRGSGPSGAPLRLTNAISGSEVAIGFYRNNNQSSEFSGDVWVAGISSFGVGDRNFGIGTNNTNAIVSLLATGNVGIGKTDPSSTLDVNGTITASAIRTLTSSMGISGGFATMFTTVVNSVYLVSVITAATDGTYGTYVVINDGDKVTGAIVGNNLVFQFSGNDLQVRSANGNGYSIYWSALRIG